MTLEGGSHPERRGMCMVAIVLFRNVNLELRNKLDGGPYTEDLDADRYLQIAVVS